jgi:starvation-inducible outer membrane lipoprotein
LGTQSYGATGTIIGGPVEADGYRWWQINYDNNPDGWSIEGEDSNFYLVKISGSGKRGDFNNDSKVDVTDLGILLSNWNSTSRPPSDLNQDGRVDVTDLGILLSNWG